MLVVQAYLPCVYRQTNSTCRLMYLPVRMACLR
nr:MAG TPA: hypothetical protein [Caudoviricetes sp.]